MSCLFSALHSVALQSLLRRVLFCVVDSLIERAGSEPIFLKHVFRVACLFCVAFVLRCNSFLRFDFSCVVESLGEMVGTGTFV